MNGRPTSGEYSMLEPYGHYGPDSKFERCWQSISGPFSLSRQRVPRFSAFDGMSHFPVLHRLVPFVLESEPPQDDWIRVNFKSFVKTEFAEQEESPMPANWPPRIEKEIQLSNHELDRLLEGSEWSNRIKVSMPKDNSPRNIVESIFKILCDPKIGSGKNAANNDVEEFVKRIVPAIEARNRLLFVLPGFPFKDQNMFRVPFDASIPDMGEIAFIIRLYNLTQTIYHVHPYGVDIVILSDGDLYRDIFGIPEEMVVKYMKRILSYRNRLNLQGAVSFISLKELIDRSSHTSEAWKIARHIGERMREVANEPDIVQHFEILVAGMKWNLETRKNLEGYSPAVCWKLLRGKESDVEECHRELWRAVDARARRAAYEYASVNLMLRWTDLISRFFPDAIRGTIHPKRGQYALAGSGGTYAWNGIASSKRWPRTIDDIRVVPYMSLSGIEGIYKVVFEDSDLPCFYTQGIRNPNIDAAKQVLGREGWSLEEIRGHELSPSDLEEFINVGMDDEYYAWERRVQTEDYYSGLLQYRISHYRRYGFGVHGIWFEGKLIGQCGLQVLDEKQDRVEVVIFLGRNHTRQGLGSRLVKYVYGRCREVGIEKLFGVVRPDNEAAMKLLGKCQTKRMGPIRHYNQDGILYRIEL